MCCSKSSPREHLLQLALYIPHGVSSPFRVGRTGECAVEQATSEVSVLPARRKLLYEPGHKPILRAPACALPQSVRGAHDGAACQQT